MAKHTRIARIVQSKIGRRKMIIVKPNAQLHRRVSELIPPTIEAWYAKSDTVEIDIDHCRERWESYWKNCMPFSEYLEEMIKPDS